LKGREGRKKDTGESGNGGRGGSGDIENRRGSCYCSRVGER